MTYSVLEAAVEKLKSFEQEVSDDTVRVLKRLSYGSLRQKESQFPWKGADVVITYPQVKYENSSKVVIKTEHAFIIANTLRKIKECASGALNYLNKLEFYGEIPEAAKTELKNDKELKDIIITICKKGREILKKAKQSIDLSPKNTTMILMR